MKKLLLGVIFIAANASAQSVNICTNSSGNSRQPSCNAANELLVSSGVSATSLGKAEDAAHATTATGVLGLGIRSDTLGTAANIAGTAGDYMGLQTDAVGALWVDPVASTARVCVAITPDTNIYAANDIVGGKLTFASVFRAAILSGMLQSIEVTNTEIDGIAFNFCLFNADPTGSTVTDQGAATIVAADLQKLIGCWGVSDGSAFAATELYQAKGVNQAVDAAATGVYGILRTTGAPTWAAAQTVNVCLTFLQD